MANNIIDAQIDEQFNSLQLVIDENSDRFIATNTTNGKIKTQLLKRYKTFQMILFLIQIK